MASPKKSAVQPLRPDLPIYPIGVAAKLVDVHPRTLRIYEAEGLISPGHKGRFRLFSANDIKRVTCLRSMIHAQGFNIPGLKRLLELAPCWEIADCPSDVHEACPAKVYKAESRRLVSSPGKAKKEGVRMTAFR